MTLSPETRRVAAAFTALGLLLGGSCADGKTEVEHCEPEAERCDGIDNDCDDDIDEGLLCCPSEMASVGGAVCIDRWEASRSDATPGSEGVDGSRAVSRPGVLPWTTGGTEEGYATARAACEAAGKRLCSAAEWLAACEGPDRTEYSYGDGYDPVACNGIDAHCDDPEPGCGATDRANGILHFRLEPTGVFERCTNAHGVTDITGNLWELVQASGGTLRVRGGAYNCGDSALLHRCTYASPAYLRTETGFRCCKQPAPIETTSTTGKGG